VGGPTPLTPRHGPAPPPPATIWGMSRPEWIALAVLLAVLLLGGLALALAGGVT
jgi:hypothetical protein